MLIIKNSKMKTIKLFAFALTLIIGGTTVSYAQNVAAKRKAPHGGMIQKAGSYRIEMVKGDNTISIYLLDTEEKTLSNTGVTGTAVFDFLNKTKSTATLEKGDKNALLLDTPKANVFVFCKVTMEVNGKTITAKFQNDAVSLEDMQHGHQH